MALLFLLFIMGNVNASDDFGFNQTADTLSVDLNLTSSESNFEDNIIEESSNEVIVNDWEDLQYYCSLNDKDYTLKLKENTNYYPSDVSDSNGQIIVRNNVKIIGSEGAYVGDVSPQARNIGYAAIKVADDSGIGITLENVTFKWIGTNYQSDGVFLVMGGNANNYIKNCYFTNISTNIGHSSILHIKKGNAILSNCTFINCTTDFGCVSVYNPNDDPTKLCTLASMEVTDCYFEGNYARTEPGCINNCGILVVNNTTFYKNSAFWWAGAIHTHGGANTTIYDSDFIDNLAGWNGGALYTYSYLQIYNSRFIGNNCTTNNGGGAIGACKYLHSPYLHIEDCLFKNNENLCWGLDELSTSGTGRGGAISLMDDGALELYNNIFIENSASIGSAVCAISGGLSYGSPDVKIVGNQFINHTHAGDVLDIRVAAGSISEIRDNYFVNNSIVFEKLKLTAEDPINGSVAFHLDVALKNPKYYDEDILEKSNYHVYVNGAYHSTVSTQDFTLNLEKGNTAHVYVVPSISNSKSNEVFAGIAKTFIYVSQSQGNDNNTGLSRSQPVKTLNKSIELARSYENIVIMDGTFGETNLTIDYNLTIIAENDATITVTGNAFTIADGDVKFVNVSFKNSKYGSSTKDRLISQTGTGFLIFEGCIFKSNEYKAHIEANGAIEGENLIVSDNKDGSFIKCDSIKLKSSIFTNNVATYTLYKSLLYSTKTVKFEVENLTFIGNTVHSGCIYIKGSGTVDGSSFIGNKMTTSNGRASAIVLEDGSLVVQSSKFISNTDVGKYSSVIYLTSGTLLITDSILINNIYENTNNLIINGGETPLKKLIANNNWWGNTLDNLDKPALKVYPSSNQLPNGWDPASYWLVLNVTTLSEEIELNNKVPVQFTFTQIDNYGNVSAYDSFYLPSFDLELTAVNGTCDDGKVKVEKGLTTSYFTLTDFSGGSLTGSFNGISSSINFKFIKSSPDITVNVNDTTFRSSAEIEVILDSSVTGDLIVTVGNITQTKHISDSTTFIIPDLPVGNYTVEVNYTGNEIYYPVVKTAKFSVNKLQSVINISCGEIELYEDVILDFNISDGATGIVEVYVNNKNETINVGDIYIITNITRGNYHIKAVYKGDNNYLESSDEFKFEVGKSTPSINVNVSDITYGDDAVITVTLDNDATGNVSVVIDGKLNTTEINNGHAILTISGLDAGQNKLVNVSYAGDNKYKKATATKTFSIEKAILDFTINSNDIKVGMEETIEIILPAHSGGTITLTGIKNEVKNVPLSGNVKVTYTDLENGSYTVFAEYNGDNYQTFSKSTTFEVSLWDEPQWANEDGDIRRTGKSPYDSDVNGELKWYGEAANITGNLAIDSEGNVYVTTKDGIYSFYNNGTLRWTYLNDAVGVYFSGISIGRDVIISPKADDSLYFVNQTTGERYGHSNLYQGSSYFAPVVDSNANVYISGQGDANNPNLIIIPYNLWENGGTPIVVSLGNVYPSASPTVIGDIVVVPCGDAIKVVNISSKTIVYSKSGNINVSSVVGDGNIIYSIFGDSIVAFSLSGSNIWTTKVTGGVGNQLAVDIEQGIYAVNSNGTLYRYDLIDGSELEFTDLTVTSGILVGNEGNVYFASDNIFYALDCDGNILWKSKLDSNIIGKPIMDKNGIIYVNGANKVYALGQSSLKNPNLTINAENVCTNQTETITVTLNENATGFVEITINGNKSQETIINGRIVKTLHNLVSGDYHVAVEYLGDLRFTQATKSVQFTVLKSSPNMKVSAENINVGDTARFYIELNQDATGTVSVNIEGKFNSSNLIGGAAEIIITGLTSGIKVATIEYIGDVKYSSENSSCSISVNKVDAPISVNGDDIDYGSAVNLEIILPEGASGTVKLILGEDTLTKDLVNSKAIFVIGNLDVGEYLVNVVYEGDGKFKENSTTHEFKVNKNDAKFTAVIPEVCYGDVAVITVNFFSNETGYVVVTLGNQNYTQTIVDSKAVINIDNLAVGNYPILITYFGDKNHDGAKANEMITVDPLNSHFNIESEVQYSVYAVDYNAGERGETLTFKLMDSNNKPISGVSVKVNYGANEVYETTDGQGIISFVVNTQVAGTYKSSLYFAGNEKYNSAYASFSIKVNKKPITITAKAKTFKAKLKTKKYVITLKTKKCSSANGKIYLKSGKKVILKLKGKVYAAKINAKGKATFKITKLTKKGKFTATIKFNGDSTYEAVTKKVKITIK